MVLVLMVPRLHDDADQTDSKRSRSPVWL